VPPDVLAEKAKWLKQWWDDLTVRCEREIRNHKGASAHLLEWLGVHDALGATGSLTGSALSGTLGLVDMSERPVELPVTEYYSDGVPPCQNAETMRVYEIRCDLVSLAIEAPSSPSERCQIRGVPFQRPGHPDFLPAADWPKMLRHFSVRGGSKKWNTAQIVEDPEDEKVLMDYEPPPSVRFESLHRPGLFLTIEEEGDELVLVARDKPSTALTDSAMAGTTSFMSLLTGGLVCSGARGNPEQEFMAKSEFFLEQPDENPRMAIKHARSGKYVFPSKDMLHEQTQAQGSLGISIAETTEIDKAFQWALSDDPAYCFQLCYDRAIEKDLRSSWSLPLSLPALSASSDDNGAATADPALPEEEVGAPAEEALATEE